MKVKEEKESGCISDKKMKSYAKSKYKIAKLERSKQFDRTAKTLRTILGAAVTLKQYYIPTLPIK